MLERWMSQVRSFSPHCLLWIFLEAEDLLTSDCFFWRTGLDVSVDVVPAEVNITTK